MEISEICRNSIYSEHVNCVSEYSLVLNIFTFEQIVPEHVNCVFEQFSFEHIYI